MARSLQTVFAAATRLYCCFLLLAVTWAATTLSAEPPTPAAAIQTIPSTEVSPDLETLERVLRQAPPENDVIVEGARRWNSPFLVARRIVFGPDALLMFSSQAQSKDGSLFIVADQIVSRDMARRGQITAESIAVSPKDSPGLLPARDGADGSGDDSPGEPGQAGVRGLPGSNGTDAPRVIVLVRDISRTGPLFVLNGQSGATGGTGQKGGNGGNGSQGHTASQSAFDCRRGPGDGGNGGDGGSGGEGGPGGNGGSGGVVIVIAPRADAVEVASHFGYFLSGGNGGAGGVGGAPGTGGRGGPAGAIQPPWCRGGANAGRPGLAAGSGKVGSSGLSGQPGRAVAVVLSPAVYERLTGLPAQPKSLLQRIF